MLKKAIIIAGGAYLLNRRKVYCSPEPPLSHILRGEYENKIRRYSPPQKIFDVFATIYEKGRLLMSLADLLKAICFYNYSLSDQTRVQEFKPEKIIKFLGKDDRFEIYDYFVLARFLAFDKQKIQEYFLRNKIIEMSQSQFVEFIKNEVCSDYINYIKKSFLIESRQFRPDYKDFEKKINKIAESMFEEREDAGLTVYDLQKFRKQMVSQLYDFQFLMLPVIEGVIDGIDFARSIIKYVEPSKTRKYTKRIKRMCELEQVKVDKNAYKAFHIYLWGNHTQVEKILNERGAISTSELSDLINSFVNKKGSVSKEQIDVIVKVLDYDDSGFLEKKEVLGVLKNLQYYTTVKSGELTFTESIKQDFDKLISKLTKIQEIIEE